MEGSEAETNVGDPCDKIHDYVNTNNVGNFIHENIWCESPLFWNNLSKTYKWAFIFYVKLLNAHQH